MNNSSEQQVRVLSSLVIRNLLFLTGALVFLLWPFPTKLLAAIIVCSNCDCTDSSNNRPGAFCTADVVCSENPNNLKIIVFSSSDECPNQFPTVFNEANITGQVGWSSVHGTSVGTSISYNRVCHSFGETIPCVGSPISTGSLTMDTSCCSPPPPPPPTCKHVLTCTDGYAWNAVDCQCEPASPIIIDISGKGFDLTSAAGGVRFDISGTGTGIQMGWTEAAANNAFLALPGPDGLVHNGKQFFGNFTPQPASDHLNGFAALAVYDDAAHGGNGDGVIDSRDAIFSSLRLWIDTNHDGICQPEELQTLPSLGVYSISLHYELSMKQDKYGNIFRYRSRVNPSDPDASNVGRIAYDVFLTTN